MCTRRRAPIFSMCRTQEYTYQYINTAIIKYDHTWNLYRNSKYSGAFPAWYASIPHPHTVRYDTTVPTTRCTRGFSEISSRAHSIPVEMVWLEV